MGIGFISGVGITLELFSMVVYKALWAKISLDKLMADMRLIEGSIGVEYVYEMRNLYEARKDGQMLLGQ